MKNIGHKIFYKKITILAVVIVAAVVTVYLASPLFISTEVNEPFPPNSEASVSFESFKTMTEEQRIKVAQNMSDSKKNELMIVTPSLSKHLTFYTNYMGFDLDPEGRGYGKHEPVLL